MSYIGDVKIRRKYKTPLQNTEDYFVQKKALYEIERTSEINRNKLKKEIEDVCIFDFDFCFCSLLSL